MLIKTHMKTYCLFGRSQELNNFRNICLMESFCKNIRENENFSQNSAKNGPIFTSFRFSPQRKKDGFLSTLALKQICYAESFWRDLSAQPKFSAKYSTHLFPISTSNSWNFKVNCFRKE
jgi:hypothetical protein